MKLGEACKAWHNGDALVVAPIIGATSKHLVLLRSCATTERPPPGHEGGGQLPDVEGVVALAEVLAAPGEPLQTHAGPALRYTEGVATIRACGSR